MKKASIVLFVLFVAAITNSFAQTMTSTTPTKAATDFYAGRWDISVVGSPRGDIIFVTNLVRKEGKLTGELVNGDDKRPITKVEESANKLILYFMSSQAGEISVELEKVDNDNLKGNLMGYTATAVRVKEADFFAGKWEVLMIGIPDGDKKFIANLTRKDGKLTGHLSDPTDEKAEKVAFTSIEEEADKITLAFSAKGYDLTLPLEKVDADNLKGQLMGMFETKAVRMK